MRPIAVITVCSLALAGAARATYYTGFEAPQYAASAQGVPLSGQNGWYQSQVPGSAHYNAYTYAGNGAGFAQNPVGGNQFIGATTGPNGAVSRAQIPFDFGFGAYTVSYDMASGYTGTGPAQPNLGWFQLDHYALVITALRRFININNFSQPANPGAGWRSAFFVYDAAGAVMPDESPGPYWETLQHGHWYRQSVTFDFVSNRILRVAIFDLHSGEGAVAEPSDWFLGGGALSTLALPAALRFGTGGNPGNTMGWDNLLVIPAPATALSAAAVLLAGARRRRS